MKIIDQLISAKFIPVIRTDSFQEAEQICDILVEEGINTIELTLSIPEATKLVTKLKNRYGNNVTVGMGTVQTVEELQESIDAGSEFIVTPYAENEVVDQVTEVPIIPGCMTVSEIAKLKSKGFKLIKVFPASVVGQSFIKSSLSIFPDVKLMPTGGISGTTGIEWIENGASCVGIGSDLNKTYQTKGEQGLRQYIKQILQVKESLNKGETLCSKISGNAY
ncbi:bifunctional 4-hydroxy-2-oxoglutarate aldolase/2-dehydro-3-deoxy-phosphogluconate aldolase [Priestia flexa]|uniref:bifunctional 4-hydroxy-2-oxoglutarate aldolase/2-dehydro-3-deoxy-phosphogluconate aldolase n=1 Tax=Priestia flexa TaxID=86664 RepID=UPI001B34009C|nr:bifunctional 4-hydroxy-2-oxoglutarate aldolase/2-dehydro-3-deoxy-phosphogluconate aldolase [Priestia flexa]